MRLINNDGVIFAQKTVVTQFCQQNTIGHQLNNRLGTPLLIKTNFKADSITKLLAQLFGNSVCHAACRQSSWLRVPNLTTNTATCQHGKLWQLSGFPGTRLASNDNHLVINNRLNQIISALANWQIKI